MRSCGCPDTYLNSFALAPPVYTLPMSRAARASPYIFLAVPMGVLLIFTLIPTLAGLFLSLFQWDGTGWPRWVGLGNFRALAADARFWPALINTLVFVILTVPASTLLGFALAVAVHAKWFKGRAIARTMLFLPTIVSIVAVGFVWRWMLEDKGGLLPASLRSIGLDPPDFLQGGSIISIAGVNVLAWPMLSIILVQVWRTAGFCMVLYLAALSAVSDSLYEAAEVDGASPWQSLRAITIPQVRPMTAFLLITGVIGALQVFDLIWAITVAAETDATNVLNLYVLREFQRSRLGYAATIGVVIFALTLAATAAQLLLLRARSTQ